jgi:fibronectin-binding autotransporter adhesin
MKVTNRIPRLSALMAVFLAVGQASAETVTWDGGTDRTWTEQDSTSWSGGTYHSDDTVIFNITGAGDVIIGAEGVTPGAIIVDSPSDYTFSGGPIGGSGGLSKAGKGALKLSGKNSYSGPTEVSAGILAVSNQQALGESTVSVGIVGSLQLSGGITIANALNLSGEGIDFGGALVSLSGDNTVSGEISTSGRITAEEGSSLNITGGMNSGGYQTIDACKNATVTISKNPFFLGTEGVFNVNREGTTILAVAGNTWGTTIVQNGTLRTDVAGALPAKSLLQLGHDKSVNATLDLNGNSQTVAGISSMTATGEIMTAAGEILATGKREITSENAATLTSDQSTDTLFDGMISGAVSIIKDGTGKLVLAGESTTTGTTTVKGGTLDVACPWNTASLTLGNSARLGIRIDTADTGASGLVIVRDAVAVSGGDLNLTVTGSSELSSNQPLYLVVNNSRGSAPLPFKSVSVNGVTANPNNIRIGKQTFRIVYNAQENGAGSDNMANDIALVPVR